MSNLPFEIGLQMVAGIVGGIVVARATREHSLGILLDAIAGAVGAGIGSVFLQDLVVSIIDSGVVETASSGATRMALLLIAAGVEGAIVALLAGMAMHMIAQHRPR